MSNHRNRKYLENRVFEFRRETLRHALLPLCDGRFGCQTNGMTFLTVAVKTMDFCNIGVYAKISETRLMMPKTKVRKVNIVSNGDDCPDFRQALRPNVGAEQNESYWEVLYGIFLRAITAALLNLESLSAADLLDVCLDIFINQFYDRQRRPLQKQSQLAKGQQGRMSIDTDGTAQQKLNVRRTREMERKNSCRWAYIGYNNSVARFLRVIRQMVAGRQLGRGPYEFVKFHYFEIAKLSRLVL